MLSRFIVLTLLGLGGFLAAQSTSELSGPSPAKPVLPYLTLTPDYNYREIGARTFRWKITAAPGFPADKFQLWVRQGNSGSSSELKQIPEYVYLCLPNTIGRPQPGQPAPTKVMIDWQIMIQCHDGSGMDASADGQALQNEVPFGSSGLFPGEVDLTPCQSVPLLELYHPGGEKLECVGAFSCPGWNLRRCWGIWPADPHHTVFLALTINGMTDRDFAGYQTPAEKRAWDRIPSLNAEKNLPLPPAAAAELQIINRKLFSQALQYNELERKYRNGLLPLLPLLECHEQEIRLEQEKLRRLSRYSLREDMKKYAAGLPAELRQNLEKQLSLVQQMYDAGAAPLSALLPYKKKILEASIAENR